MKLKRVVLVAYPGIQILDVTGPAAVFSNANRYAGDFSYRVEVVSSKGGLVESGSGVALATRAIGACRTQSLHTLLVSGGEEPAVRAAMADRRLGRWLARAARAAKRYGSVCSGTFVLAANGLLDGLQVATHWQGCRALARLFPSLTVSPDALYVVDGCVWTSAGVTTGIDMALAMVEADAGASVAASVAQSLVVYARRPGHQSQFSPLLRAQIKGDAPFSELVEWVHDHLHEPLRVEQLAAKAGQSVRDFHRKFLAATGETPAQFVESLRLDQVRALLSHDLSLKEIATQAGFGSAVRMSRAFERRFGVKPSLFREMVPGSV